MFSSKELVNKFYSNKITASWICLNNVRQKENNKLIFKFDRFYIERH